MTATVRAERVMRLRRDGVAWRVKTVAGEHGPYDEVLLAPGQPETEPDLQLARWRRHADAAGLDLVSAYPGSSLIETAGRWRGRSIGMRGLGLSTLDVIRLLTIGLGGRFDDGRYLPSGLEPARIVPFSLDGQAPAPKPANAGLDARFGLSAEEEQIFEAELAEALRDTPEAALGRICDAITLPVLRILKEAGGKGDRESVRAWLGIERANAGAQETRETRAALAAHIAEAQGIVAPSTGFTIGQVWRKLQPVLRRTFPQAPVAAETAAALNGFDEGLKRFSYGPPLEAAEQLLVLIDAGLVDPRAADDPDIVPIAEGWALCEDGDRVTVSAMIDAVIASPSINKITEPVVQHLYREGLLSAVDEGLGARTTPECRPIGRDGQTVGGLALAGRLALGSVIAADSIHDCFGDAIVRWADSVGAPARMPTLGMQDQQRR